LAGNYALSENLIQDGVIFVIDMIKDALDPGEAFEMPNGRDMYTQLRELLQFARDHKIPIVYTASQNMTGTQLEKYWWQIRDRLVFNEGSDKVQPADAIAPIAYSDHEVYLPKSKYSAFYGTRLDVVLRNGPFRGRNTIIVTGMATNFCCFSTVVDAFNRDYHVLFVDDLNCTFDGIDGTPKEVMHNVTVETIKQGYAIEVLMADELLRRLDQEILIAA
jgi:nicotinamidase-related amidase